MNRTLLALALAACPSGDPPAPSGRTTQPASSGSAAPPVAAPQLHPTPFSLPKPEEFERRSLAPLPFTMLVRPGLEVRAWDDRKQGGDIGIQVLYPNAAPNPRLVSIAPQKEPRFENVVKHKEWLFQHSELRDIVVLHEDASSIVYEATEAGGIRSCRTWANKQLGEDTWFAFVEATRAGDKRHLDLPPTVCGDLLAMVRSLEPEATGSKTNTKK